MDDATTRDDLPFDPTRRKLCPDGACVGVIGADGRCRVCGRTEAHAEAGAVPAGALEVDGGAEARVEDAEITAPDAGDFDSNRRLCDDGSCVGLVGDDGVCRVCGRRSQ
ncbi:MAG TPA: hypothetical protein VG319_05410 [Polyangia bacterium]|jgi:hypothetical protein|nr:hypothetical protein [Polyangia bacterium]